VRALNPRISNPLANVDPERRNSVLLVAGISAVVLFALGLIAYGYYADRLAPQHDTVLIVGERTFDYSYLERRAKAELAYGRISLESTDSITLGIVQTLDLIEREELVRQAAAAAGISVSQKEIDDEMRLTLRTDPEASRERFAPILRDELLRIGLPFNEFEAIIEAQLLDNRLRDQMKAAVPAQADHADVRLIQLPSQEKADEAKRRLAAGDSPAAVAATMSVHASRSSAGELGWTPRGALPDKVDAVVFSQMGVSDVIPDESGWFIVETRGIEVRDLTDSGKAQVAEHSLTNLLARTRDAVGRDNKLTTGQLIRVGQALLQSRAARG
jgi:parvulin-like peptidyl-prolyl isomerase